ncbi:MAG: hypothetical protein GX803_01820 [Lentisphaerae bacterium]|nr:hypothetical protein [Lentisphaerota bacterium]
MKSDSLFWGGHWPRGTTLSKRAFCSVIICIALLSFFLHLQHLVSNYRTQVATNAEPIWMRGFDAESYWHMSESLRNGQPLMNVFRDRPVVPILFNCAYAIRNNPMDFLCFLQIFHGIMPCVLAALTVVLFKNRWCGLLAAGAYIVYIPAYEASQVLNSDFIHACLLAMALLALLLYLRTYRWRYISLTVGLWGVTVFSRPTFMLIGLLLLPALIMYWRLERMPFSKWVACVLPLLIIPVIMAVDNWRTFGVFTYSLNAMENVHTIFIPSIHTTNKMPYSNKGYSLIRLEEREMNAKLFPPYRALKMWSNERPASHEERRLFKNNIKQISRYDRDVIRKNPATAWRVIWRGAEWMLFSHKGLLPHSIKENVSWQIFNITQTLALTALVALAVWYRQLGPFYLLGSVMAVICLTSSPFYWTPLRFMMPIHFILLALLSGILSRPSLVALGIGTLLFRKALNLFIPNNQLLCLMITVAGAFVLLSLHMYYRQRQSDRYAHPIKGCRFPQF